VTKKSSAAPVPTVVVHGGAAGTDELIDRAVSACETAAKIGTDALAAGANALQAVEASVKVLEDAPVLNAGTGASLTSEGGIELDASIMDGATLDAGAVAALIPFRNPISIAAAILAEGRHMIYAGDGAARFAVDSGFEPADPDSMITEYARRGLDVGNTVGAVALDAAGNLAAATSTGGVSGQAPGRVGDSPIIGAGIYARNGAAACSATGDGEAILRATLARDVVALIESGASADAAVAEAIVRLEQIGRGTGGLILLDSDGDVGIANNTAHMSHAIGRSGRGVESGS
jgi:beta-aspartyl-peptidase (threonine type)